VADALGLARDPRFAQAKGSDQGKTAASKASARDARSPICART
jgi:hypothetical protein